MFDARHPTNVMIGAGTAKDCSSTGVFAYTWNLLEPARIWRLAIKVTVVMSSTGGVVFTFRRRPTYGATTAQSSLGTVTATLTAAANTVFYNDITPVNLNAGDQIVCDCTTAATTSGSAIAYVLMDYDPETAVNSSSAAANVWTKVTA